VCDVCLSRKRDARGGDGCERRVVEMLKERALGIKELVTAMGESDDKIISIVDKMVREGKILLSERGKLKIIE
jgi:NCAIR mutase (PurE)-related protein